MKSVVLKYKYFKYIFRFLCLFTALNIDILNIDASELKNKNKISEEEFSSVFKGYSNMFKEKDINSHLREFFGLNPIQETRKINYPDLSIINDSKNLRELYDAKLNQMTSIDNKEGVIDNKEGEKIELFFKEKI